MIDTLHHFPAVAVYLLFALLAGGSAWCSARYLSHLVWAPFMKEHLDVAMRTTTVVVSALALILAFCAAQARGQFHDVSRVVELEASGIAGLARLVSRKGSEHEVLRAVRAYLQSVVDEEWPVLSRRERADATDKAFLKLENEVRKTVTERDDDVLDSDLMRQLDLVEDLRERRLAAAALRLPEAFWTLIIALFGFFCTGAACYHPRPLAPVLIGLQAAALGCVAAFIFVLDAPFSGPTSVDTAALEGVLSQIDRRLAVPGPVTPPLP